MSTELQQDLQARVRSLALEKSILELVLRMMARVSEASGVDDAVEQVLSSVMDVIGGTNTTLYYLVDNDVVVVDVFGRRDHYTRGTDSVVDRVFDTSQPVEERGDFSRTLMQTAPFTQSFTWAYPLRAGSEVVGVLVMQDLHVGMSDLQERLPIFFTHAAHVLKNRLQNYARLQDAFAQLNEANAALHAEIAVRTASEEALREARSSLEVTVADRTRELRQSNDQLHWELAERRRTEEALRRRNAELAATTELLHAEAADHSESELLGLTCRELGSMLGLPLWRAWSYDEDQRTWLGAASSSGAATSLEGERAEAHVERVCRLSAHGVWHTTGLDQADPLLLDAVAALPGGHAATVLSVPLRADGRPVGCLLLASPERRSLAEADEALAIGMATRLGGAIARARARADARRLRAAIEQTPDSVVITDEQARIVYVNSAFCANTGYERADVLGQNPRVFKSGQHDRAFYETMWRELVAGRTWRGRLTNRKKNGELVPEAVIITPVHDARGRPVNYLAIKRDVTKELLQEDRLRHAERMAGVGQFAGGIAHDFNNILAAVIMQVDMLRLDAGGQMLTEGLDEIRRSADRAATLTRQLLAFSQRQTMIVSPKDVNDVVAHVAGVLRRALPDTVAMALEPTSVPLVVSADAAQLEQVLMNLCVNARDAMPDGGKLTIATEVVDVSGAAAALHRDARPGRCARLRVTDTGIGMSPDVRSHLFEPFFTTKGVGKGTGLGLATAHGIIRQHNGWIDVETSPGRGTTFFVYLPLEQQNQMPPRRAMDTRSAASGPATVLVVEDEEAIRRLLQRCLEHLGYRVLLAPDGVEGWRLWESSADAIDLVLSDIVMPRGVSGVQLRERLHHARPDLPVVLMSGYHDDVARAGAPLGDDPFLAKPFTMAALADTVARALSRRTVTSTHT